MLMATTKAMVHTFSHITDHLQTQQQMITGVLMVIETLIQVNKGLEDRVELDNFAKLLKGTKFQLKVWNYLKKIPRGRVKTYSQVAKAIGRPSAVRAVANAVGKNPYPPKIPCHRVIRSDGSLGGYSGKGGVKTKKLLLKKEGIML